MAKLSEEKLKPSWKNKINISLALVLMALALAAYLSNERIGIQVFAHITFGRWILANRMVPFHDIWTVIGNGHSWLDGSWLFDLIVAFVEQQKGLPGLVVFKIISCSLIVYNLANCYAARSGSAFIGFLVAVLVAGGLLTNISLTPVLVSLLILPLMLRLGEKYLFRAPSIFSLLGYVFCSLLLANISKDQLLLVLVLLFALFLDRRSRLVKQGLGKRKLLIAAAGLVPTFITPYFGLQAIHNLGFLSQEIPLNLALSRNPGHVFHFETGFLALVWSLIIWAIFSIFQRSNRTSRDDSLIASTSLLSPAELFIPAGLSLLALVDRSLSCWALLFAGYLLAGLWSSCQKQEDNRFTDCFSRLKQSLQCFDYTPAMFFVCCLAFVNISRNLKMEIEPPLKKVENLLRDWQGGTILHSKEIGDYLVFLFSDSQGNPLRKTSIDSRAAWFSSEVARREKFAFGSIDGGEQFLDWLEPELILCQGREALCQRFFYSQAWSLVTDKGSEEDSTKLPGGWFVMSRSQTAQNIP